MIIKIVTSIINYYTLHHHGSKLLRLNKSNIKTKKKRFLTV